MALVTRKFCYICKETSNFIEGHDSSNIYRVSCLNCSEIQKEIEIKEQEKESRKMLRDGILSRTRRNAKAK